MIEPDRPATELPTLLQKILTEPSYAANAQAFAQKYSGFSQEGLIDTLVQRIEQIRS